MVLELKIKCNIIKDEFVCESELDKKEREEMIESFLNQQKSCKEENNKINYCNDYIITLKRDSQSSKIEITENVGSMGVVDYLLKLYLNSVRKK